MYIILHKKKSWKFSMNKFHENSKKVFYRYYDSNCSVRALVTNNYIELNGIKKLDENIGKFILKSNNDITYYNHSYIRNNVVKLDYKNELVTVEKLKKLLI